MSRNIFFIVGAFIILSAIAVTMGTALAQLDNKPYSFKNTRGGGPGMSPGGQQAIINEKLFDSTPDNLQRGPDGRLVDVIEGPGKSAIVFRHGTTSSIPGFRGSTFRGQNELMQSGIFNPYFGPTHSSDFAGYSYTQFQTAAMINSWTSNIDTGNAAPSYFSNNSVDSWTAFVNSLRKF